MKFYNQLRYATQIVHDYQGEVPLHAWLKQFFREHKQMGSKDRKLVSNLVYGFYRLGHAVRTIAVEERLLTGFFLCQEEGHPLLEFFKPAWNAAIGLPPEEKIRICQESGIPFDPADIFPWKEELSPGIPHAAFCLSFLRQPDLFLRIRPGMEALVKKRLEGQFTDLIPPSTLRLPNGFPLEQYFTPDREIVIQDYSSQRIASFLQEPLTKGEGGAPLRVWDACAASGGKSILAWDLNPAIELTVSDIRESMLNNLRQRFREAGIAAPRAFTADLTKAVKGGGPWDLIMVDAPCSGSGTWGRTPEELYFFHPDKIGKFAELQRTIVRNLSGHLRTGDQLLYITCSVFRRENEEVAALLGGQLQEEAAGVISGYAMKADSMFAARFVKG